LPTLIGRPQRQIALLLVKGLQARLGGGVYRGASRGKRWRVAPGLLYRAVATSAGGATGNASSASAAAVATSGATSKQMLK
jgi:hypothetical protein